MNRRKILMGGGALALASAGAVYFGRRKMGSIEEYASVAATRARLSERPEIRDFVRYVTLASNGHNTQPWRFRIGEDHIQILPLPDGPLS